jgi:hypothetical protein
VQLAIIIMPLLGAVDKTLAQSNVNPAHKFAWGENVGWSNWRGEATPAQGVIFYGTFLTGFVWGENIGWINVGDGTPSNGVSYANLFGTDFGVNLDSAGNLHGFAWGENAGWINFDGGALASPPQPARIESGRLRGYAWGENIGWINLDNATHFVSPLPLVSIAAANPPTSSPYGTGRFRDVLQNTTPALVPQGIGMASTPSEGPISYAPIAITFSGAPIPLPAVGNISRGCTDIAGNGQADCPTITSVSGTGAGPYLISLSAPPPPRECITIVFAGTNPGQKLQYQVLPGDTNLDGTTNLQDLLWLVQRLNDGTANVAGNLARYDIDRSGSVNTQDLLRLIHLLNGTNATQAFNGATVAPCPD